MKRKIRMFALLCALATLFAVGCLTTHAQDGKPLAAATVQGKDRRTEAFVKAVYVGDETMNYTNELTALIAKYQKVKPETSKLPAQSGVSELLAQKADLLIYAATVDALSDGGSNAAAIIEKLATGKAQNCVFAVCGVGYYAKATLGGTSVSDYAAALCAVRQAARKVDAIYFDAYAAMGNAAWSVAPDGKTPSASGKLLLANGLFASLARQCTCLAADHTAPLDLTAQELPQPDGETLRAFVTASDKEELRDVLHSGKTTFPLTAYHMMNTEEQAQLLSALVAAERSKVCTWDDAETIYMESLLTVAHTRKHTSASNTKLARYVATGDSISCGATAVNRNNGWVPTLSRLLSQIQGSEVLLINQAVSGSRMCLRTTNDRYPPAKDTVQEYIVANHPDFLTAAFGINDLRAGVPLKTFLDAYRDYVRQVQRECPDTLILLVGMLPLDGKEEQICQWNAAIKALAEELDVLYSEPFYDLLGTQWLFTDGLHPCDVGYRVQASGVLQDLCSRFDLENAAPKHCTVTFADGLNGKTISNVTVEAGNVATAPQAPAHFGYRFVGWNQALDRITYSLTVTTQYEKIETSPWSNPFCDVSRDNWYYESAAFACQNELCKGVAQDRFEPESAMTRAMLVTVLWRYEGSLKEDKNPFTDVKDSAWYAEAVAWASEKGMVNGVGGGKFEPDGNITREQMATVLFRYAEKKGMNVSQRGEFAKFADKEKVSSYAKEALQWAVAEGIIAGSSDGGKLYLNPQGKATRAEVVTLLMRFFEKNA